MVLGKDVYDAHGSRVGNVVDVGVHDMRRVKFLLVEGAQRRERFTRFNADLIDTVGASGVILRPTS